MKVAVVGAGLSGLSTAIALRKYVEPILQTQGDSLELKIYDKADPHDIGPYGWNDHADIKLKNQGAAISLQSNALRVLRDLSPELADRVYASGFPCKGFTWKTGSDYILGREYLDLLPISRPILIQCLMEALPKGAVTYRTVKDVELRQGRKPVMHFDNGEREEVDLVVGADGIRSQVRQSILGDESQNYQPKYLGMCAVGGVLDGVNLPSSYFADPTIIFIESAVGFFGYCALSQAEPDRLLYFSIYDSDLPARGEALDHDAITAELRQRHSGFADPKVRDCVQKAKLDNIYPIFYMPNLPFWGRDGAVMVGDAASAMTPTSGQGGSQAFESGQALALILAHYLSKDSPTDAVSKTIPALYEFRHERVEGLKAFGLNLKEPQRPWSLMVTGLVYTALFCMLQVKYLLSFLGGKDSVRDYDLKVELKDFLARRS